MSSFKKGGSKKGIFLSAIGLITFLFVITGCSSKKSEDPKPKEKTVVEKIATDYWVNTSQERLAVTPGDWQTKAIAAKTIGLHFMAPATGDYTFETIGGHGTWTLSGQQITLNFSADSQTTGSYVFTFSLNASNQLVLTYPEGNYEWNGPNGQFESGYKFMERTFDSSPTP